MVFDGVSMNTVNLRFLFDTNMRRLFRLNSVLELASLLILTEKSFAVVLPLTEKNTKCLVYVRNDRFTDLPCDRPHCIIGVTVKNLDSKQNDFI